MTVMNNFLAENPDISQDTVKNYIANGSRWARLAAGGSLFILAVVAATNCRTRLLEASSGDLDSLCNLLRDPTVFDQRRESFAFPLSCVH